ncbi:MAG: monovalent cation/H+ antiporter subunit D family protein [Wenzhouxiangella sp.]|nr:monovalent cation/H+ antiporter subunit D family protein [Wenzhouxiangella sp.]
MIAQLMFWLPLAAVLVSAFAGLMIFVAGERRQRLRTWLNIAAALLKLILVGLIGLLVMAGHNPEFRVALLPGLDLVLRADGLSMLFATLSALLWLVTTIYAIAYLEHSPNRARFFGFFSLCVTSTMGIAMAGNLLTFFIFYELLTLTTWPLVVHTGSSAAMASGRTYLRYTLTGSALFLIGLIWLYGLTGSQDFIAGGTIAELGLDNDWALKIIFWLLVIGMGVKAALVPLHRWLPLAMVAPAPVSALLHAVAVVKAGAFGLVRLVEDVFGPNLVADLGLGLPLAVLASITIIYGSVLALYQNDIKKRLAFSTVSQVSYITLGIALGGPVATIGGLIHLVHQGLMKITLFFCAGIFANLLGVKKIAQLDGIGQRLPWTSACFPVGALGMIGVPPVAGFISKWYLGAGAVAMGQHWVIAVLVASTLLNAAYFLPLLKRIWLHLPPEQWPAEHRVSRLESAAMIGSSIATASFALAVGLLAGLPLSPLSWVTGIVTDYFP